MKRAAIICVTLLTGCASFDPLCFQHGCDNGYTAAQIQQDKDNCWMPDNDLQPRSDGHDAMLPAYWAADAEHGFGGDRVAYLHSPTQYTGCLLYKPSPLLPPQ